MKVNLWCGRKLFKDYVNVDCVQWEWVDKVVDLDNYPWDFEDNSIDEIYADNIIEHLDYAKSTKEIYRILKVWWTILIKVPYFSNPWAFFADHKCFFNFDSYNKYCSNMNPWADLSEPYFELVERKIIFIDDIYKWLIYKIIYFIPKLIYKFFPRAYIWFLSYTFPASELHFKLKKI